MEISKLFEKASSLFDTAHDKCAKSGIDISCITLILSENDVIFHGVNWKRLKDDFTEEETCSEYEALIKMILSGETKIKSIITLNNKKETVKPCLQCAELILSLNIENKSCNVITGKKSQITLSSCDKEIDAIIEKFEKEISAANPSEETESSETSAADPNTSAETEIPKAENTAAENTAGSEADTANPSDTVKPENDIANNAETEKTETAEVKSDSFNMESINVSGNEILSSAAEDKLAHNSDNSNFAMEEINQDNAPEPIDNIQFKGNINQQSVQMADINDNTEPDKANSEANPVSHLGIDNSGLKMIFDDWEAIDVSDNSEDSIANKPFNLNSLNSVEASSEKDTPSEGETPVQPDQNAQNLNGMYQQQPMNGMYQQQPMNGMYQQQPMNGMYQQQPMNGMYQQQPMNGMYQQQPMNGMYQQQPMNGMYQQQPMNSMYQQPMNGMYQQQPMNSMYQQQPINSMYQKPMNSINSPGSLYVNQMPQTQSVSISNYQNPYSSNLQNSSNTMSKNSNQSMSVYGTNINSSDNNAIFKDRLNNILNSGSKTTSNLSEEQQYEDAIQSAKDRKKAAKIDAKFLKKQKKNGNL